MILKFKLILMPLIILVVNNSIEGIERLSERNEEELFGKYLEMFNITFDSHHRLTPSSASLHDFLPSRKTAKENFLENFYSIEAHNERYRTGNETFRQAIHPYAHLSREEFVRYRTGLVKPSNLSNDAEVPPPKLPMSVRFVMPDYFNWVDRGIITPVRNQGLCGACYAFAALAAVEAQMGLQGNSAKLSEQEVVDCATHFIESERILLGCKGGDDTAVYDFAKKYGGVTSELLYPYEMRVNRCNPNRAKVQGSAVRNYVKLPIDEEYIKEMLYLRGPLYASFHASDAFAAYSNGIFTDPQGDCRGEKSNHAALLVGWGTQYGLDYWIAKNSYDTWWGEGGFFRIARGYNLCNIASDVSYPILN